jgi:hypothetical protein
VCEIGPSVFVNNVLVRICGARKEGRAVGLVNLRNKEPRNFCSLLNVILVTKWRRIKQIGHVRQE